MTATGLPFLVTITRSWVPATSSMTWLKCAFTAASDCVIMTRIMVITACRVNGERRAVSGPSQGVWVMTRHDFATLSEPRSSLRGTWEQGEGRFLITILTIIELTRVYFAAVRGGSVCHVICTDALRRTPSILGHQRTVAVPAHPDHRGMPPPSTERAMGEETALV